MKTSMLALAYAVAAISFYVWSIRTAKPVASPLGVVMGSADEGRLSRAA